MTIIKIGAGIVLGILMATVLHRGFGFNVIVAIIVTSLITPNIIFFFLGSFKWQRKR